MHVIRCIISIKQIQFSKNLDSDSRFSIDVERFLNKNIIIVHDTCNRTDNLLDRKIQTSILSGSRYDEFSVFNFLTN